MAEKEIKDIICYNRKRLGLTQEQLAAELGVTPQAVSNWERGIRTPSDYMKVKIAQYYGVTVESIFFPCGVLI